MPPFAPSLRRTGASIPLSFQGRRPAESTRRVSVSSERSKPPKVGWRAGTPSSRASRPDLDVPADRFDPPSAQGCAIHAGMAHPGALRTSNPNVDQTSQASTRAVGLGNACHRKSRDRRSKRGPRSPRGPRWRLPTRRRLHGRPRTANPNQECPSWVAGVERRTESWRREEPRPRGARREACSRWLVLSGGPSPGGARSPGREA
jgi:hypothetical protein